MQEPCVFQLHINVLLIKGIKVRGCQGEQTTTQMNLLFELQTPIMFNPYFIFLPQKI